MIPHVSRKIQTDISINEPITLEDLRWLVEQCKNMVPESRVSVQEHKEYTPTDSDQMQITVHGVVKP